MTFTSTHNREQLLMATTTTTSTQPQLKQRSNATFHDPSHNSKTLSPSYKQQQMMLAPEEFYSPRTITLGNHSESILGSFHAADNSTSRMLSATKDRLHSSNKKPYMPAISSSSKATSTSRPIRIVRRKPAIAVTEVSKPDQDDLSASPRELKHFYDEATWRMYHLIQAARLEKQQQQQQEAKAAAPRVANQQTTGTTAQAIFDDGMKHLRASDFFIGLPPKASMSAGQDFYATAPQDHYYSYPPMEQEEDDDEPEGVFELDDL